MIRIYPALRAGGGERGNLGSPLHEIQHKNICKGLQNPR